LHERHDIPFHYPRRFIQEAGETARSGHLGTKAGEREAFVSDDQELSGHWESNGAFWQTGRQQVKKLAGLLRPRRMVAFGSIDR